MTALILSSALEALLSLAGLVLPLWAGSRAAARYYRRKGGTAK